MIEEDSFGNNDNKCLHLSVVIPAYNAQERIVSLISAIINFLHSQQLSAEIILVDDCSTDQTWHVLKNISPAFSIPVRGYRLTRNCGQHAATAIGINQACGTYIVTMDDDFNPAPSEISKLLENKDQSALIYGTIQRTYTNFMRKAASRLIHKFMRWITDNPNLKNGSSFRLFHRILWIETCRELVIPEKLDIALIHCAKGNISFVEIVGKHNPSSHSLVQLINTATKLITPSATKLTDTFWLQNSIFGDEINL